MIKKTIKHKILPISQPFISAMPDYGHILSMLAPRNDLVNPWILSQFIQLQFRTDRGYGLDFTFYNYALKWYCPWVRYDGIDRELLKQWKDEISFVTEMINSGYYVAMYIDGFYIKAYGWDTHTDHRIMIYGYDTDKKTFYVADSFKGGKYKFETMSFTEFSKAQIGKASENYDKKIELYKPVFKDASFFDEQYFDVEILKKNIYSNLNSINPKKDYAFFDEFLISQSNYVFGISVFEAISKYVLNTDYIDLRPLAVLKDQVYIICRLYDYLVENRYLKKYEENSDLNERLFSRAKICLNLAIKCDINDSKESRDNLSKHILMLAKEEEQLLGYIYENVSDKPVFTFENVKNQEVKTSCKLISTDRETMGEWNKKYGSKGYIIPAVPQNIINIKDGAEINIPYAKTFLVPDDTYPEKKLHVEGENSEKIYVIFDNDAVEVEVLTEATDISFYFLNRMDQQDGDFTLRIEAYDVLGNLLSHNDFNDYKYGIYVTYHITGYVKFKLSRKGQYVNKFIGELYGVFLD